MSYYKWLTTDLTSHWDRGFQWELCGHHKVRGRDGLPRDAGSQGLFLLKRPEDALRFGSWPGRLFSADPIGDICGEDEFKVRSSEVRLGQELDPALVFGPHGKNFSTFLSRLKEIHWLKACRSPERAIGAANLFQERLKPWGWVALPVKLATFDDWGTAAEFASVAKGSDADRAARTAWATQSVDWYNWVIPWAGAQAWRVALEGLQHNGGRLAWNSAKASWQGQSPWPAPNNEAWRNLTQKIRLSTRLIATAAARDAARAAEYLIGSVGLPPDPYVQLMAVWEAGYFPMGISGGNYIVGDLSGVVQI